MLTIRLQRTGRRNLPTFRVVVAEHAKPVKGKCIEIVGLYLPKRDPSVFEVKSDRIVHWIRHGARPSDTVARLLKGSGFTEVDVSSFIQRYAKQKKKKGGEGAGGAGVVQEVAKKEEPKESKDEKQGDAPQKEQ